MGSTDQQGSGWACLIFVDEAGDYYSIPWESLACYRLPDGERASVAAFLAGEDVRDFSLPPGPASAERRDDGDERGWPSGRAPPRTSRRLDTLWLIAP